ncbi:hypothetical protein GUITHDRAFT_78073, partial [Guillardia theta CCMP2712]
EASRRKIHNELQEVKGNIRTFCRIRPASSKESCLSVDEDAGKVMLPYNGVDNDFRFDRCFGQTRTQLDIFEEVKDFVQSALDGYNVSLLAYGQTGAGKTFTMLGGREEEAMGIIPRSINQILETVAEMKDNGWEYELAASFLEIYNETIRDLLCDAKTPAAPAPSFFFCCCCCWTPPPPVLLLSFSSCFSFICYSSSVVQGTDMNERSSRSHTVFQLRINAKHEQRGQTLRGSLHLVDLAGSERLAKSNATGDRLKETQSINKSLSALGDVMSAIAKKQAHVPYSRNSKLTFLLQPCLSGDGKALVILAASPVESSAHETLCSLRFGNLIAQCELGKATRHVTGPAMTGKREEEEEREE